MKNPKKQRTGLSSPSYLLLLCIPLVVVIAVVLAYPQPKLDWEKDFLPMARGYVNTENPDDQVLKGLTVAITGATSGIGKALTQFLVGKGATVVAMGRSAAKLEELTQETTGGGNIVPITMELTDLNSVANAADEIKQQFESIDVLVCNAGMHYTKGMNIFDKDYWKLPETKHGHDISFTVNYLSHFLLTEKLLPALAKSPKPLLLQMSSSYHWGADGRDLDPIGGMLPSAAKPGGPTWLFSNSRAYANSKLAQILHARALRTQHSFLRTVSVCPAWAATSIGGDPGSLTHTSMSYLAYPLEDNGWGLASTLRALLDYDNDTEDFYINTGLSRLGPYLLVFPHWMTDTGLRILITDTFAIGVMLFLQKFFHTASPAPSSVESYDMELGMRLYHWSKEKVKEYL